MDNLVFATTNSLVWVDWMESHPNNYEPKFPSAISR